MAGPPTEKELDNAVRIMNAYGICLKQLEQLVMYCRVFLADRLMQCGKNVNTKSQRIGQMLYWFPSKKDCLIW